MPNCNCSLSIKLCGDGCKKCQPETYIFNLENALQTAEQEIEQLRNEVKTLKKETVQRVVTQLSTVFVKEGSYSNCDCIHYSALCNDGTMWSKEHDSHTWQKIQNVPQSAPELEGVNND